MIKNLLFLLTVFLISSCGISKIKENPSIDYLIKCDLEENIKIYWIGNAKPIITSKTIIGRINRFVIPYTRNTDLIELEINNTLDKDIIFEPLSFYINIDNKKIEYLRLDYFKEKWPTSIILTNEQLIDQSIAIGEVIRTIVRKKIIDKNSKYSFIIPFAKINKDRFLLSGNFKINQEIKSINCQFVRE